MIISERWASKLISTKATWTLGPCYPCPGGLPYKSDGDTHLLALGCKFQILVSLRVFGMESHYICPFRYHLSTVHKEIYK